MATRTAALALALALGASDALAQVARQDFYITNGTVNAQFVDGNSLYLGGSFTHVGPVLGCGVPLSLATGAPLPGFPQVDGQINALIPDGAGGWYLGGLFTHVGSANRSNLAHVRADLSVSSWNPGTDGQVFALALQGGTVFAGGAFASAGGQPRNRIAALDTTAGAATAWNPGANDVVRAFALSGNTLFVGGRFTNLAGVTRMRIGALNVSTAAATAWNPGASLDVLTLAVRSGTIYAGGMFTVIGGATRNRIAALDSTSGSALSWNPGANGQVNTIALSSNTLYAGGTFSTIATQVRLRLAEITLAGGTATAWDPGANSTVTAVLLDGGTLYAGGDFTSVGGETRSRLASLSTTSGLASAWNPVAFSTVQALALSGGVMYAGGAFGGMGGIARNNLAAIDLITGTPTAWNPNANGPVLTLKPHGNTLYVGGAFTQVGGQARAAIAALDLPSGTVRSWNPGGGGQVTAFTVDDGKVYVGGFFSTMGGLARSNLAAIDTTTGLATSWAPQPDGQIFTLMKSGGLLYAGGSFTAIGGQARDNLASVSLTTGLATSWDPDVNGTIRDLAAACGSIYVGGFFTQIGGQARNRLAALDPSTGTPTSWNPNANGPVFCISLNNGVLYAGGVLNVIGGLTRNRLAALDPVTGVATSWNPNLNGTVRAIAVSGGSLYVGGSFTSVGSTLQCNVAALPMDASITCPVVAVAPAGLPHGIVGSPYSQALSASGGRSPYCWLVTEGLLPSGLSLDPGSGLLSGTPTTSSASAIRVTVTDANGCTGERTYTLDVFAGAIGSTVTAVTTGLCLNPVHPCVTVPVVYQRNESTPARAINVTIQLDASRVSLCTPGSPYSSIQMGSWLDAFPNSLLQVVDNGGGAYTVDALILGVPCGQPAGGTLFTLDLKSVGADGPAAVTVTSVHVRDCSNGPIGAVPGAPESLLVQNAPVGISPDTLPSASANVAYRQELSAAPGTAPFAFTLTSGSLPLGLSLSAAGVIEGVPIVTGSHGFTLGVSDVHGCVGSRAYTLSVGCAAIVVRPGSLPDASLGAAYAETLTTSVGRAPYAWSVVDGSPPGGLSLSPAGVLSGTINSTGTFTFTASVLDSSGCTSSRSYTITSFPDPIVATLRPDATGLCMGSAHPWVNLPFVLTRTDTTHARAVSVTFRLDTSRVVLRTPANPEASVHAGSWFGGGPTSTQIIDLGDGSYTVDVSLLGEPCGPATGGVPFAVEVASTGPAGIGTVRVTASHLRDCDNVALPVAPGASASILIGAEAPAPIADLVATPLVTGNGTGATTGIQLAWTHSPGDTVRLYRAPYASYPGYAGAAPDSALAPAGPWTLVSADASPGIVDHPGLRGFWYYVALVTGECGDTSAVSNRTWGTLDYVLGDVADGFVAGSGNNAVGMEDISLLGANYGIGAAQIAGRGVGYLDVAPTTDLSFTARPVPDGSLDFDDLMVFTGNFGTSATAPARARPALRDAPQAAASPENFRLDAPQQVEAGANVEAVLSVTAAGRMQGFSIALAWDPDVLEPVAMHSGGFVESQNGLLLSPAAGAVDAALLGVRSPGLLGEGEVARITFRTLRGGTTALRIERLEARDAFNHPLPPEAIAGADGAPGPVGTALLAPAPNPFRGSVLLGYSLARAGDVQLTVYSVDGRRVRVLAKGHHDAGTHRVAWDGRDDRGAVAPGIYYARYVADGRRLTTRLVYLR